jgi:hypothetical protein
MNHMIASTALMMLTPTKRPRVPPRERKSKKDILRERTAVL